jgi:hypothetical protein
MDLTGRIGNFGSPTSAIIAADFPVGERHGLTIKKEILWESETATDLEAQAKESEFILALCSYDPGIGSNGAPRQHLPE